MIRRRRFAEVVSSQLDLFARDHGGFLADCEAAERAYDRADRDALEAARAGARRAREELTWDAAAAAHLELYRELE